MHYLWIEIKLLNEREKKLDGKVDSEGAAQGRGVFSVINL